MGSYDRGARAAAGGGPKRPSIRPGETILELAPPGWPVVDRGLLMAYVGRLLFVFMNEQLEEAGMRRHMVELRRALEMRARTSDIGVVYWVRGSVSLDAIRRRELADLLRENEDVIRATTRAYGLVTHSPALRAFLNMVLWFTPPTYPHRIAASLDDALTWLAPHVHGLDATEALAGCRALLGAHAAELAARPRSPR